MPDALQPLRFLLCVFAGLVNRDLARTIHFMREENRVLREQPVLDAILRTERTQGQAEDVTRGYANLGDLPDSRGAAAPVEL